MLFKDIKSKKNLLTPLSSDTKVFVCRIPEVLDGVAEHHLNCFCCGDWSGQPPGGEQFGRQLQNERHHCPLHAEFKAGGKIQFSRQSHFALAPFRKPIDTYVYLFSVWGARACGNLLQETAVRLCGLYCQGCFSVVKITPRGLSISPIPIQFLALPKKTVWLS